MVGTVSPRLTPIPKPGKPLVERIARHIRDTERREQVADDGVGLHLAAFQRVDVRADFLVDELAHGVAHGKVDVRPFEHSFRLPYRDRAPAADPPERRWCAPGSRPDPAATCAAARSAWEGHAGRGGVT